MSKAFNLSRAELKEYMIAILFLIIVPTLSVVVEMINAESAEITWKSLLTFFSTALLSTLVNLARMWSTNYQSPYEKRIREETMEVLAK